MAATIRDVAHRAHVAVGTVSRAFNGYDDISPETKERVLRAAAELGYSPNLSARNLAAKNSLNLGMVVSGLLGEEQSHTDEFLFWLMHGAYRYAKERGLELAMYSIDSAYQERKSFDQFCAERNLSGAILFGLRTTDAYYRNLAEAATPFVTVDTLVHGGSGGCVTIDDVRAFQELTQYLFDRGHRRLLIITGRKSAAVTVQRTAGAYEAYRANGIPFEQERVVYCDFREEQAYMKAKKYLRQYRKTDCTAFLCMSDVMAVGVLRAVKECGYRVPDDFSLVGYDGVRLSAYTEPQLTTVDQKIELKGHEALALLEEIIRDPASARCVYLPHVLLERGSVSRIEPDD